MHIPSSSCSQQLPTSQLVQSFIAKRHALLDVALGQLGCDREVGEEEALLEQVSLVHAAVDTVRCSDVAREPPVLCSRIVRRICGVILPS